MKEYNIFQQSIDFQRVAQALHYIEDAFPRRPDLDEIAAAVHLSPFCFQRLFTRWSGISPGRFQQYLTLKHAKNRLRESRNLMETSWSSGLSGSSRLHDLFVTWEAMTPGQFKEKGKGVLIKYGFHPTPFGNGLIDLTDRGICHLSFANHKNKGRLAHKQAWPKAKFQESPQPANNRPRGIDGI